MYRIGDILKMHRLAAAMLLCCLVLAQAQDAKPDGSLTSNPVYEKNCAKCHGKTAEGRFMAGPSLLSGKAAAMSADDLRTIITNGKHHMPKFGEKLSSADIDALVDQIQARNKQK
jgi:mono/diheme cytochrome c family protein